LNDYFHVTDWLPTLASVANTGIKFDRQLDGLDLSNMIKTGEGPFRKDVETIDEINLITSIIHNDYKLMNSSFVPLSEYLFIIFIQKFN
jgi:hypothetical protein